jgi:HSP20 family protein
MQARWQPLEELRSEMSRLFDRWGGEAGRMLRPVYPPLNLWEDADHVYVEAELPGLELSDLEIYVSGHNQLSIKGERKVPQIDKGAWHRQERSYGAFTRTLELPFDVDADKVSAQFKNGVLTITLPKRDEVKPRRIEVKVN